MELVSALIGRSLSEIDSKADTEKQTASLSKTQQIKEGLVQYWRNLGQILNKNRCV